MRGDGSSGGPIVRHGAQTACQGQAAGRSLRQWGDASRLRPWKVSEGSPHGQNVMAPVKEPCEVPGPRGLRPRVHCATWPIDRPKPRSDVEPMSFVKAGLQVAIRDAA